MEIISNLFSPRTPRASECNTETVKDEFYEELLDAIRKLIAALRINFGLIVRQTKDPLSNCLIPVDELKIDSLGKPLWRLYIATKNAMAKTRKIFNWETLVSFKKAYENDDYVYFNDVYTLTRRIYAIILADFKNPFISTNTHFQYQNIDDISAVQLVNQLLEEDSKANPVAIVIWRIIFGMSPEHAQLFIEKNASLIFRIRQLNSFQHFNPFTDDEDCCKQTVENPWLFSLFNMNLLMTFINTPCSEKLRQLLINKGHVLISADLPDESILMGQRLFSSQLNTVLSNKVQFPMLTVQENFKQELMQNIIRNHRYTKDMVNDLARRKDFELLIGLPKELFPLFDEETIISLFLHADKHAPIRARIISHYLSETSQESSTPKRDSTSQQPSLLCANLLRNFVEYQWLLTSIIISLKKYLETRIASKSRHSIEKDTTFFGTSYYLCIVTKIPYLLYELIVRENGDGNDFFSRLSKDELLLFFHELNIDLIFETLQLLDPQDQTHCFWTINDERFEVDKTRTTYYFHHFIQLLLCAEFRSLRLSWFNNRYSRNLICTYPFLFIDADMQALSQLSEQQLKVVSSSIINCQRNGIDPFVYCPSLQKVLEETQKYNLANTQKKNIQM